MVGDGSVTHTAAQKGPVGDDGFKKSKHRTMKLQDDKTSFGRRKKIAGELKTWRSG